MRLAAEPDRALRHFERDAAVACGVMALVALVLERGRPDAAAGVLAGGALTGLSYWALKGVVNLVVELAGRHRPEDGQAAPLPAGRKAVFAVKFFARYALLAVGAYVMLACFRVHPVGLLAGAATPFLGALAQVARAALGASGAERR